MGPTIKKKIKNLKKPNELKDGQKLWRKFFFFFFFIFSSFSSLFDSQVSNRQNSSG